MLKFFSEDVYGNYTSHGMSLGDFKRQMDDGSIIVPEYQRNFVWTPGHQQRYLDTLCKRGPIFGFVMNYHSSDGVYELIDGQNRGKTIHQFMSDELVFDRSPEEGGALKYSDIEGQQRRIFDRMEIHFIKTIDWDEDACQEYFRTIQDGMKLTKGEEIHSAQNNIFQHKIAALVTKYNQILRGDKKDGGFNYTNKRFIHLEVVGGLLKMFMDNEYKDRAGQVALKELKSWDGFPRSHVLTDEETERLAKLDEAVHHFEGMMNILISLRINCVPLTTMTYNRDATFIRNMFFIHQNEAHILGLPSDECQKRFSGMMETVLTKHTLIHDEIKVWGGYGGMDNIMAKYRGVFDGVVLTM
jgi:hypothetical protein